MSEGPGKSHLLLKAILQPPSHRRADEDLEFLGRVELRSAPATVFVVHGEERQSLSLAEAIRTEQAGMEVCVPERGATYEL